VAAGIGVLFDGHLQFHSLQLFTELAQFVQGEQVAGRACADQEGGALRWDGRQWRTEAGTLVSIGNYAGNDPAGFDLVVNATPLGLSMGDPLPFDAARLDAGARVVDILMKPLGTPLLAACAARGIEARPGFEMLVQQVPDYLEFFGLDAAAQAVRADLDAIRSLVQRP